MGFNLKMMFDELLELLEEDMPDADKIAILRAAITGAQRYAEECGQLR